MKKTLALLLPLVLLAACGGTYIGHTCTSDADCVKGMSCFRQVNNGFCSRGCTAEGETSTCPGGTICAPLLGNTLLCSPICQEIAECRTGDGLTCGALLGSTQKGCRAP